MIDSEDERRTFNRYCYDGAVVRFMEGRNFGLLKRTSRDFPMKDISRSGIRLELDKYRDPGSNLDLIIDIPGKPKIQMRGNVRWVVEVDKSSKFELGILFAPYGSRKEYNPYRNKDRLKNMLEKKSYH